MSITILIIEDDLVIAHGLKENLQDVGYRDVCIADNAAEAIQLASTINPDLFIVDIILESSSMNGVELVHFLQKGYDKPFIFLTSMDDKKTKLLAKATNPAAYLIKPIPNGQLDITIDLALSNHYRLKKSLEGVNKGFINGKDRIFVKSNNRYHRVNLDEIVYLEANSAYCKIHTNTKSHLISQSLKKVMESIALSDIFRTHKTYAVSEKHITSFDQSSIYLNFRSEIKSIPISRSNREGVMDRLERL
jgi:DNA-binding LytR/AlgR family response regulator